MLLAVVGRVGGALARTIPVPAEVAVAAVGVEVEAREVGVGGTVCDLACLIKGHG